MASSEDIPNVPSNSGEGYSKGSGGKKKQKRIRPSSDSEEEIDTKTESSSATVEGTSKSLSKGHHGEHDIGSGHGLTDVAFKELLTVFSEWYDQRGYLSMLKVLYSDLVDASLLFTASKTMDLMYMLMACGELDSTNLKIIYDTINSTATYGLEKKIKSQIPSCPNIRDVIISEFTPHRQKIMKFGMALMDDDIVKISELYNKPVKEYADTWSLIMDLERQMVISEANNEDFIEHLKKNGLHQAVNALTEGVRVSIKRKKDSDLENNPLEILTKLQENIGALKTSDIPSFSSKFRRLHMYFKNIGLHLSELEDGSIKFCLIAHDLRALQKLRKLQETGELRKDLLAILLPEEHQQEDLDEWMTYLNENEFKATLSLSKQKEKGFAGGNEQQMRNFSEPESNGKKKNKRKRHLSDSEGASGEKVQCIRNSSDSEDIQNASSKSREDVRELSDIDFGVLKKFFSEWYESKFKATLSLSKQEEKENIDLETESSSATVEGTSQTLSKGHHEEHDIGSGHGITDKDFKVLLSIFSNYYDKIGYIGMLKVLYRGHVENTHRLNHASTTSDLLDLLSDTGALDLEEYSILCETIKATKTFGLEKKIKHLIPSCPNIRDVIILNFTTHRQGVIKLGMALSDQDIVKISKIYNDPIKEYADPWSLIMDLEHRTIICEENMGKFIENLKKFELNHAVKVLTKGIIYLDKCC
ncbi:uncharacterized protein LOC117102330 isoform X2 [Anneissia japonica]|uniref:uncharacterized protein LOC117102330 isoform X2 n=1 Tax=Anneissia japonica TaxID=1529436 RepID=UPI0014256766|nr:uncharacterized protein LOC117102330 isoform X2 [Anneissia japonica]XP_033098487.1 uncharacterized protein LOC117102330 isoform X2 [Anneissia japonica]